MMAFEFAPECQRENNSSGQKSKSQKKYPNKKNSCVSVWETVRMGLLSLGFRKNRLIPVVVSLVVVEDLSF